MSRDTYWGKNWDGHCLCHVPGQCNVVIHHYIGSNFQVRIVRQKSLECTKNFLLLDLGLSFEFIKCAGWSVEFEMNQNSIIIEFIQIVSKLAIAKLATCKLFKLFSVSVSSNVHFAGQPDLFGHWIYWTIPEISYFDPWLLVPVMPIGHGFSAKNSGLPPLSWSISLNIINWDLMCLIPGHL